jgi:hypothetical protein
MFLQEFLAWQEAAALPGRDSVPGYPFEIFLALQKIYRQ